MAPLIRPLAPSDLPSLLALSASAGWNQTPADWSRLLHLAPSGCWGVESGGAVVSSATLVTYGRRLAWVGMVLTLPDFRGRGYASSLLARLIADARARGIQAVRLDATAAGRPVYEKLGFHADYDVERWRREPGPLPAASALPTASLNHCRRLDAFEVRRSALLDHLLRTAESAALPTGFAFARPGRVASHFGPAVVPSPSPDAGALLDWFLARHGANPCFWDLCPANAPAVSLAREHGFTPVRTLLRMTLGRRAAPASSPHILALAGFEWG